MVQHIKDPLSSIQMKVQFLIPQEYVQTLNETSSRVSSSSKQHDGARNEFDSMITECKTRI